nr:DL-endopeptidase inhibitor IseA family protein [Bacillus sp. TL12]
MAVTIMTAAMSVSVLGCETEKKTSTTSMGQETKEEQIDSVVKEQMQDNEQRGNAVGNISNKGKMAENNGWIYYAISGDQNITGIYRTKDKFQTSEPVIKGVNASYINIKEGVLYFIHWDKDKNTNKDVAPSLMKYDISTKKLDTMRMDAAYVYVKNQSLFYEKKYSERSGFSITGIARLDLKTGKEEEAQIKTAGWAETIDDSIVNWNRFHGTQVNKGDKTWAKEGFVEISSGTYNKDKLYAIIEDETENKGIYELDIEKNKETLQVEDALQMNIKGDSFYYLKKDGVYKRKINGGNEKRIYEGAVEPSKTYLYFIAGDMYLYRDSGLILNLDTKQSNEKKEKKPSDDVLLQKVVNAQQEIIKISVSASPENTKPIDRFSYGELTPPEYNTKTALETSLATYFSTDFITKYMKSEYVKEIGGKMHYVVGDLGSGAGTKYTKIISAKLKEGKILATADTYNDYEDTKKEVEIEFIYENKQWVVDKMPRFDFLSPIKV